MNERIKELLARPGLERLNDWANIGPVQKAALEEFTDLVVLECVRPTDAELERRTGEPHIDGWPLQSGLPPPAKEKL
jgi:hypothetical protein